MRAPTPYNMHSIKHKSLSRQQDCQQVAESHVTQEPEGAMSVLLSVPPGHSPLQNHRPHNPSSLCPLAGNMSNRECIMNMKKHNNAFFQHTAADVHLGAWSPAETGEWDCYSIKSWIGRQRDLGSGLNGSRLMVSKWTVLTEKGHRTVPTKCLEGGQSHRPCH